MNFYWNYYYYKIYLLFFIYNVQWKLIHSFCESEIYCKGILLDTIQKSKILNDSKVIYIYISI